MGLTPSVPTKTYLRRVNSNPISGGRKAIGVRGLRIRGERASVVLLAILFDRKPGTAKCWSIGVGITLRAIYPSTSFLKDDREGFIGSRLYMDHTS